MQPERLTREEVLDDEAVRAALTGVYPDRRAMVDAVFRLRWRPRACGVHGLGEVTGPGGVIYNGSCVEVPRSKFDRVTCFADSGDGFRLVDTFLLPQADFVRSFVVNGNIFRYSDVRGNVILERAVGAA